LAVEFAAAPQRMEEMPASYALFKRLSIPEVIREFAVNALPLSATMDR
jgi:hypothetical protein